MSSSSVKQFVHYGQLVQRKGFQKYDHGSNINLKIYTNQNPENYNLGNIKCPLVLHHGDDDKVIKSVDVEKAMESLPNVIAYNKMRDFQHLDFIFAMDADELINDKILKYLKKFNTENGEISGEQ